MNASGVLATGAFPAEPSATRIVKTTCPPDQGLAELRAGSRVLVIRLRSMGDTVLLTPALKLLHEWRRDLRVSVLLETPWNELLEGHPAVDSILTTGGKLETLWRMRRAKFDAVINLHGGPTSAQITRFSAAPLRVGLAHFRSQSSYNLLVPRAQDIFGEQAIAFHTAEHAASVFFWLGVPPREIPRAELFPSAQSRDCVKERLRAIDINEQTRYAVIHPAALYATKQWSADGFAAVARHLEQRHALRPVFLCANHERATIDSIEKLMPAPVLRAGGWPISEMMALIAGAKLFLGNDSGPAHVAAALNIPVVVIFGSSSPAIWGPWKTAAAVAQNYFDCNPCAGDRCYAFREPRCILSITTEQVMQTVDRLLGK